MPQQTHITAPAAPIGAVPVECLTQAASQHQISTPSHAAGRPGFGEPLAAYRQQTSSFSGLPEPDRRSERQLASQQPPAPQAGGHLSASQTPTQHEHPQDSYSAVRATPALPSTGLGNTQWRAHPEQVIKLPAHWAARPGQSPNPTDLTPASSANLPALLHEQLQPHPAGSRQSGLGIYERQPSVQQRGKLSSCLPADPNHIFQHRNEPHPNQDATFGFAAGKAIVQQAGHEGGQSPTDALARPPCEAAASTAVDSTAKCGLLDAGVSANAWPMHPSGALQSSSSDGFAEALRNLTQMISTARAGRPAAEASNELPSQGTPLHDAAVSHAPDVAAAPDLASVERATSSHKNALDVAGIVAPGRHTAAGSAENEPDLSLKAQLNAAEGVVAPDLAAAPGRAQARSAPLEGTDGSAWHSAAVSLAHSLCGAVPAEHLRPPASSGGCASPVVDATHRETVAAEVLLQQRYAEGSLNAHVSNAPGRMDNGPEEGLTSVPRAPPHAELLRSILRYR